MVVGVDFGTTNSIVSFFDNGKPQPFLFGNPQQSYIPSAVVYENGHYSIGRSAIEEWEAENGDLRFCRFFKMLLPSGLDQTRLEWLNWPANKQPEQVAYDFFNTLLRNGQYAFEANKGRIRELVVTIPQLWHAGIVNSGAEKLENIFRERLKLPLLKLISEPQAAIAYYLWKNKILEKKYILVCDVGGGTFDVSLCRVENYSIQMIDFQGSGERGFGKAGVFYLQNLLQKAYEDAGKRFDYRSFEFQRRIWELDKRLSNARTIQKIEDAYTRFRMHPDKHADQLIFKFDEDIKITLELLLRSFDPVRVELEKVMNGVKKKMIQEKVELDRLLFVGGFSQFFLVREAILEFWGLKNDPEKSAILPPEESLFAISYGASLVAAKVVEIKEFYPHTIGIIVNVIKHDPIKGKKEELEREIVIIKGGQSFTPDEPFFAPQPAVITESSYQLRGFYHLHANLRKKHYFDRLIKLPQGDSSKRYHVGFIINSSNIARLVMKDITTGQLWSEDLGQIIKDQ